MSIQFKKNILIVLCLLVIDINICVSQNNSTDTTKLTVNKVEQKDAGDLFNYVFKKKKEAKQDTIKQKSLGPFFSPLLYPGYAMVTGYLVGFASNISFYTNRNEDAKISSILLNTDYSQYNQSINIINSNLWFGHEKFNLIGDWRIYKFPTNTFGLGSTSSLSNADPVDYSYIRIYEVVMTKLTTNLTGGMGYDLDYHWNIKENKTSDNITTDLDRYGFASRSVSSGISFNLQYDNRINSNNPSNGTYINLQLRNNVIDLGSSNNWQSIILDYRYYINTSKRTGNVLAFWSYDCMTFTGKPPYFDLPTTGLDAYNNTARGFVEGRFKGLNMLYAEGEYRFRLTRNGFLGGVINTNVSTISEWPSNKFEKINMGNGFGLRIKMNKASNTNLCIDYAWGSGGSQGFSFNLNEVF